MNSVMVQLLGFAGVFVFLLWRPFWWGKVLTLFAALAWGGAGLVMLVSKDALGPPLQAAGGIMLLAFLAQLAADPRLGGPVLRLQPRIAEHQAQQA